MNECELIEILANAKGGVTIERIDNCYKVSTSKVGVWSTSMNLGDALKGALSSAVEVLHRREERSSTDWLADRLP